jgi:hypothetical protein
MSTLEGGALDLQAIVVRVVYVPPGAIATDKQCRKLLLLCEREGTPTRRRFFASRWGHWQRVAQPGVPPSTDRDGHDFNALTVGESVLAAIEEVFMIYTHAHMLWL